MNLALKTVCGPEATTGTLTAGELTLHTIELPWRENAADISCVPAGDYQLLPYVSEEHGRTWRLHNTALGVWGYSSEPPSPMRTEIEIHNGNWARQSLGCILVGTRSGMLKDPETDQLATAVLQSDVAFNQLRALLDGTSEEDTLTITREGV